MIFKKMGDLNFSHVAIEPGQHRTLRSENSEMAVLLLEGEAHLEMDGEKMLARRTHWKDENPFVAHVSPGTALTIDCKSASRFAIVETPNDARFLSKIYTPDQVTTEHRGKGVLDDAAYRLVRTVFDATNAPPEAKLVIGEVINFPGRWSSYPPHHHPQRELYYYEFDPSHGFGFGQCGEQVEIVHHQDVLFIEGGKDHAQVSAPGYSMYYLWAICHAPEIYTGFEYSAPHGDLMRNDL